MTTGRNEVVIHVRGDASSATRAAADVQRAYKDTFRGVTESFSAFGDRLMRSGAQLTQSLTIPIVAIGLGVAQLGKAAEQVQIAEAFEAQTARVGIASDALIATLRKASAETVSNQDLMLSANRAMVLGVAQNTEEFAALMEIARDRARVMGLSVTQAFNDLVTGLGRGSAMILDNLGLVVKLGPAYEEYARSIGKTAEELTAAEQKQALVNAALRQGKETIDRAAQAAKSAAEEFQAMRAELKNTTDALMQDLLPALNLVVKAFGALPGPIQATTVALLALGLAIGPVTALLGVLLKIPVAIAAVSTAAVAGGAPLAIIATGLVAIAGGAYLMRRDVRQAAEAVDEMRQRAEALNALGADIPLTHGYKAMADAVAALEGNTDALMNMLNAAVVPGMRELALATEEATRSQEELDKAQAAFVANMEKHLIVTLEEAVRAFRDSTRAAIFFGEAMVIAESTGEALSIAEKAHALSIREAMEELAAAQAAAAQKAATDWEAANERRARSFEEAAARVESSLRREETVLRDRARSGLPAPEETQFEALQAFIEPLRAQGREMPSALQLTPEQIRAFGIWGRVAVQPGGWVGTEDLFRALGRMQQELLAQTFYALGNINKTGSLAGGLPPIQIVLDGKVVAESLGQRAYTEEQVRSQ